MMRETLKTRSSGLIVFGLWLLSTVVAVPEVYLGSQIMLGMWLLVSGTPNYDLGVMIQNWSAVIFGIVALCVIVGTGEYHRKHVGQRTSWRLFAWTFVVELVILAWYVILYYRL
jgi:hypothetical protein